MSKKIKRVRFGLPKPNVKSDKILFYASLNGSITPEIGDDPTFIDPNLKMVEGAYGLQAKGALKYPLKGLDLAQPFTISFTYNVTEDAYVGSWTNIFSISLKDKAQAGQNKVFQLLTTDDSEKFVNFPTVNLFNETSDDLIIDKPLLSVPNRYRRFTLVNSPEGFSVYLDSYLIRTFKGMTLKSEFKNKPELQININTGHNGNGYQRYGISEVFVAQEAIPPIGYKGLNDDSIILPRPNYLNRMGNCEYTSTVTGTIPAIYNSGDNNLVNGYGRDSYNTIVYRNHPWFRLPKRSSINTWSANDRFKIVGCYGELIKATPSIKYNYNGQDVDVIGSWTGLGTNEAVFTFGANTNLTNQDLKISYDYILPKRTAPLLPEVPVNIISISDGELSYLPTTTGTLDNAPVTAFKAFGDDNLIYFQNETNTLRMDKPITKALDCLMEFEDLQLRTAPPNYLNLTSIGAIVSTHSLNKPREKYLRLYNLVSPSILNQLGNELLTLNNVVDTTFVLQSNQLSKFEYAGSFLASDDYGKVSDTLIPKLLVSRYVLTKNTTTGELLINLNTKLSTNTQNASAVGDSLEIKYLGTNIFVK